MPLKDRDPVNSAAIAIWNESYLCGHFAVNSCLPYKYSYDTVSSSFDTIEFLYYSTDSFHHQNYSIISGGRWMRGEQFYPITASGGASSKAFWPGLIPWGIAILQETHQTHERRTSRVTLPCIHHSSPHLSLYLTGSYSLWCFVLRLTEILFYSIQFQAVFRYKDIFKCRNSFKFDRISGEDFIPLIWIGSHSHRKTSQRISCFGYILKY